MGHKKRRQSAIRAPVVHVASWLPVALLVAGGAPGQVAVPVMAAAPPAAVVGTEKNMAEYSEYIVPIGGGDRLRLFTDAHQATAPLVTGATEGRRSSVVLDTIAPTDCDRVTIDSGDGCGVYNRVAQTGRVVWPSAILLFHTLRQQVSVSQLPFLRCLQLGSGTGVVGLALARWGASSVTLTDLPHMMPTLNANIAANELQENEENMSMVQTAVLDWNSPLEHLAAAGLTNARPFDLIVAADVIYSKSAVKPFLSTLQTVFNIARPNNSFAAGESPIKPAAYVAMHERGKGYLARYFRVHARRAGFALEMLDPSVAVRQMSETLNSLSDERQLQLFLLAAKQALSGAAAGDVYVLKLWYGNSDHASSDELKDNSVGSQTQSWIQDSEMWTDLIELLRMEGGDENPNAVSIRADDAGADSSDRPDDENLSITEEERREARIAARRAARKEAKARHEYWYKHANPS